MLANENISAKSREEALILLEEGRQQFNQGNYAAARSSFKEALGLDPNNRQIKLSLASVSTGTEQAEYLNRTKQNRPISNRIEEIQKNAKNAIGPLRNSKPIWWVVWITVPIILVINIVIWRQVLIKEPGAAQVQPVSKVFKAENKDELKLQEEVILNGELMPQDQVILTVPNNSLQKDETFTISFESDAPAIPQNSTFKSIGRPVKVISAAPILRQPVLLKIRYNAGDIPENYDGNSLQVARWDGSAWDIIDKINVDREFIAISIDHFSSPIFRVIVWNKAENELSMAGQIEAANQVFFKDPKNSMAPELYKSIVTKAVLASMSEADWESYWIAFNLWADALYQSDNYDAAGNIYLSAVKIALASGVNIDWNNQLLTSPGYALDALQKRYPLGVKLSETVRSESWASKIPERQLTLSPEYPYYQDILELDFNQLPPAITRSVLDYESTLENLPTDTISTSVGLLVLSSVAQSSQDLTNTLDNKIEPFLQDSGVENIPSTSLEGATKDLIPSVKNLLNQNPISNRYMIDPAVPGEELHTHSPMIMLKVERAWVNYSGLITHSQHVFAINQMPAPVGEAIGEVSSIETAYRLTNGKIETSDSNYQWIKIGQALTHDIKTEQSYDEKSLALGSAHACVLTNLNGIQCWGKNDLGQLGTGDTGIQLTPVNVKGITLGMEQIVAGDSHTCALSDKGKLFCWGSNANGQVGNDSQQDQLEPIEIQIPEEKVLSIAAGTEHTCALTGAGNVYCWGRNDSKQLGVGASPQFSPILVPNLTNVQSIAAGGNHTCVLLIGGKVQCWGDNQRGQLGNNNLVPSESPITVENLPVIKSLTAGFDHTCVITETNAGMCWGGNGAGQLGIGNTESSVKSPTNVQNLQSGLLAIKSFKSHTCAIKESAIDCWGNNQYGQLGNGQQGVGVYSSVPVEVFIQKNQFVSIGTGNDFTCVRTKDGLVYCWGKNDSGQLGNGSTMSNLTPVAVDGFGTLIVGADKNMRITPATGNVIELGKKIQIQVVNPTQNPKSISYLVSYDDQPWVQIAQKDGADTSAAEWDSTGSALGKKVSFKIIIEAIDGTTTETSDPAIFTIGDTLKPTADIIISPSEKIIELGSAISFAANNPTDTINDVAGSGVKEITFIVLENGAIINDPKTLPYTPNQVMWMVWPAPPERKSHNTQITFRMLVIDNAGNEYKVDAPGYSLQDRIDPGFAGDIQVMAAAGTDEQTKTIEMGSKVKLSVNAIDDKTNIPGSGISEVVFWASIDGGDYNRIGNPLITSDAPIQTSVEAIWDSTLPEKIISGQTVRFKVTVKDVAGNLSTDTDNDKYSGPFTITDTTIPSASPTVSVEFDSPNSNKLKITASGITDGLGMGVKSAEFIVICGSKTVTSSALSKSIEDGVKFDENFEVSITLPEPDNTCGYDDSVSVTLKLIDKNTNVNVSAATGVSSEHYLYDVTAPTIEKIVIKDRSGKIVDDASPITLIEPYTSIEPYTIDVTVKENELGGSDITNVSLSVQCIKLTSVNNGGTLDKDSKSFSGGIVSFIWTPPPATKDCGYSTTTPLAEFKFSASANDEENKGSALETKRTNKIDEKDPEINSIKINGIELLPSTTIPSINLPLKIDLGAIDDEENGGSGIASIRGQIKVTDSVPATIYSFAGSSYSGPYPCGKLDFTFWALDISGRESKALLTSEYRFHELIGQFTIFPSAINSYGTYTITAVVNETCGGIKDANFLINNKPIPSTLIERNGSTGKVTITANWSPDKSDRADFTGKDLSLALIASDNDGKLLSGQIPPTTIKFNIPAFAITNPDTFLTTDEDKSLALQLSTNAGAQGSSVVNWEISVQAPLESGEAIIDADTGMLTFTPALNYFTADLNNPDKFTVRATNNKGEIAEREFQISITAVNDAPTNIELSSSSITAGVPSSRVGFLSTVDQDSPANTFTYYLAPAYLDNDNFLIIGNELWTKAPLVAKAYHIYIRSTDSGLKYFEKRFDFTVP